MIMYIYIHAYEGSIFIRPLCSTVQGWRGRTTSLPAVAWGGRWAAVASSSWKVTGDHQRTGETHVKPMWNPCEAHVKPMWNPCETHVKPMWNPCEIHVKPMWNPCETHVKPMWNPMKPGFSMDSSGKHARFSMFVRAKKTNSLGHSHFPWDFTMKLMDCRWRPSSPDGSKLVQNWCMMLEGASHLVNVFTPS